MSRDAKAARTIDSGTGTGGQGQAFSRVVIMGAAGYDFHCFNMVYRKNERFRVVAFTACAEQNLGTTEAAEAARSYPPELAGPIYPNGIPIIPESHLEKFLEQQRAASAAIDVVVLAYSDVSHLDVMHKASLALARGADFALISPRRVQLKSTKPVISVCAVRTGVGKSSVSRAAVRFFKSRGKRVVAVREPMPYGDLSKQAAMRFQTWDDLAACTLEEREEYEDYVKQGLVIFSGVDYEQVLRRAEQEADVIVWDGGNNEVSFFQSDLLLVLADPLRRGHENTFHPGETNVRMADVFVIAKCHEASLSDLVAVESTLRSLRPSAPIVRVASAARLETAADEARVAGKRVLVVEDGPTVTHGGTAFGAGLVVAHRLGCVVIDPRPVAVGSFVGVFREFSHLEHVLPALGYSDSQLHDLAATINASGAEVVLNGSPTDLAKVLAAHGLKVPMVRVVYDVAPFGAPMDLSLDKVFTTFAEKYGV